VTGHRWWWEVHYPADNGLAVTTANELRLPVGVPVELALRSADVIHSFWIPNLAGKVDLIPGLTNTLRLTAAVPGRFRLQCAEFCGSQHARMGLVAIAGTAGQFEQWRLARTVPAAVTTGPGIDRFMALGCGECHAIGGTPAAGLTAPALTHFADRPTIGGSAAANSPEALRAWLIDHGRTLKPGSLGPDPRALDPGDQAILAALLESLR
jgi:cytochrome c oxidase subunit 2